MKTFIFFILTLVLAGYLYAPAPAHALTYLHQNHQGSTIAVSNEEGEVVEEIAYEPFGTLVNQTELSYTYTDQEQDATDLLYYGARYHNPAIEQFTQPDQLNTFALTGDPQSLNPYSYTRNNPVNRIDPTGNFDMRRATEWVVGITDKIFGYDSKKEQRTQHRMASLEPGEYVSIPVSQEPLPSFMECLVGACVDFAKDAFAPVRIFNTVLGGGTLTQSDWFDVATNMVPIPGPFGPGSKRVYRKTGADANDVTYRSTWAERPQKVLESEKSPLFKHWEQESHQTSLSVIKEWKKYFKHDRDIATIWEVKIKTGPAIYTPGVAGQNTVRAMLIEEAEKYVIPALDDSYAKQYLKRVIDRYK
jgi:RHS repeat-associated protein